MKKYLLACAFVSLCSTVAQSQEIAPNEKLSNMDHIIALSEAKVQGVKPDNEAKILWADAKNYKKTDVAFVYLHGFGASSREGEPVMSMLAKKYQANVYLSRLKEHGIERENGFEYLTPENYIASAKEAVAIGKRLGNKVVVVSTSTGGTLSLTLAAADKDIAALVLYSPFIDLINPQMTAILTKEGKDGFVKMNGGEIQKQKRAAVEAKYWSTSYHVNGYVSLIKMLKDNMTKETFKKVDCPVFVGYYYKNEKEQDQVVSVPAILKMYEELGTATDEKKKVAFPESGNHVIASDLRSKDYKSVYNETVQFLDDLNL